MASSQSLLFPPIPNDQLAALSLGLFPLSGFSMFPLLPMGPMTSALPPHSTIESLGLMTTNVSPPSESAPSVSLLDVGISESSSEHVISHGAARSGYASASVLKRSCTTATEGTVAFRYRLSKCSASESESVGRFWSCNFLPTTITKRALAVSR